MKLRFHNARAGHRYRIAGCWNCAGRRVGVLVCDAQRGRNPSDHDGSWPQQPASQAGSMDNMPGMDMSAKQDKGNTGGSGQDMSNMQGMDMSGKQAKGSTADPNQDMSNMPGKNISGGSGGQTASMANMTPGTVMLDAATQQKIGVTYTTVRRAPLERTIRTVGLLQMDDEKIARVHVKVAGWIEKVDLNYVGKLVKKGQPLFTLYSPDLGVHRAGVPDRAQGPAVSGENSLYRCLFRGRLPAERDP